MAKKIMVSISLLILVLTLQGCNSSKSDARDVENNITSTRRLPVRVLKIEPLDFSRELRYTSTLEGSVQSEARSNVEGVLLSVNVSIGQKIRKNQIIAAFDEDLPASGFIQAKSAYENSKRTYERMENLYEAGGISKQQLDETETYFTITKANYEAAKKNINVLSPIDGIVSNLGFRAGDNVPKGAPIATIVDFSVLKAKIWVDEGDVGGFYQGLDVRLSWRGHDSHFSGTVSRVSMSANPARRAFEVEISIDNRENILKPGILVEVTANINRIEDAVVIPKLIIQHEDNKDFVFVISDGKAYKRFIKAGLESRSLVEVREGLSFGDHVVIEGQFSLTDQSLVVDADQD